MREVWKAAAIEDYQNSYRAKWTRAFEQIQSKRYDHHVWLLGPSSYVFLTDGVRWGMDLQFRLPLILDTVRDLVVEDLAALDFILLTHEHSDHLDYSLISMLSDKPVKWIIPAFFDRDKILATGLSADRITWVEPGQEYDLGKLKLNTFESLHFRPSGQGVREIGYLAATSRSRILFPGDVRNYDISKMPHFGPVDCLFSHVWLGGGNALNLPCEPWLTNFCDFTCALDSELVLLTHLYEIGRPIEEMWTYTHAGLATDGLLARNPSLEIVVPRILKAYSLLNA